MYDLIYAEAALFKEFKDRFPDADFEDARDETHEERFGMRLNRPEIDDEYIEFLIKSALCECSFLFQMHVRMPDGQDQIRRVLDKLKADKNEA